MDPLQQTQQSEIETKTYASETSLESPKGTVLLRPDRLNAGYSNKLYFPKGTGTVLIEWTSGSKGGNRGNPKGIKRILRFWAVSSSVGRAEGTSKFQANWGLLSSWLVKARKKWRKN